MQDAGEREFRFLIKGLELEELKRHWHHLPEECASLQPKIQRYQTHLRHLEQVFNVVFPVK